VIHRDLKPANVMVGAFGEVQVMDWGLAKLLSDDAANGPGSASNPGQVRISPLRLVGDPSATPQSLPGTILGTPAYMPPEQADGAHDRVDERADVFGLGALLCELLTGHPPYVGGCVAGSTRVRSTPTSQTLSPACGSAERTRN
jgi:serine/threonine-protein kinase